MLTLLAFPDHKAGALQGEVAGDGVGTGVQTAEARDIHAVFGLLEQLFLTDGTVFQIQGEGPQTHRGVIACLGRVAGGLFPGNGCGFQIVQQGTQLAVFDDVLPVGGAALCVEMDGLGIFRMEGVVTSVTVGAAMSCPS